MDSAGRTVVSKGPIQYRGAQLVEEELIGFLQNGVVYSIHVEARANGQTAISSNKLRRGISSDHCVCRAPDLNSDMLIELIVKTFSF